MKKLFALCLMALCLVFAAVCSAETIDVCGLAVDTDAVSIDFDAAGISVTDADALLAGIEQLPGLTEVLMYDSPMEQSDMERVFDACYPRVFFGFTLHVGPHTIRTDVTAFSTLHKASPTKEDPRHTSEELSVLRMCTKLKALDMGHNYLTDISWLKYLPEIEVLIISPNYGLKDISAVGYLTKLVYLECFHTPITDISCLRSCPNLRDLNLTRCGDLKDISPLYDALPNLERFWWGYVGINAKQMKQMRATHPNCKFKSVYDPTSGGWRSSSHFKELHAFFRTGVYVPFSK